MDSLFTGIPGTDGIDHSDPIAVLKAIAAPPQAAPASAGTPVSPVTPPPPVSTAAPQSDRWRALMNLIAPIAGFVGSSNPVGQAAFMNAWNELEQKHTADVKQKQEAGAKYLLEVGQHAMSLTDPAQFDNFLNLAEEAGTRAGWIKPGDLKAQIKFPASAFAQAKVQELSGELDQLEKNGYNLDDLAKGGASVTLKDGSRVPVSIALDLTRKRPMDTSGNLLPRPAKADVNAQTDFGRFLAKFAKDKGKTVDQLTSADELEAKTQYNGLEAGKTDFGRFLSKYAKDKGTTVDNLTTEQELDAKKQYGNAGQDTSLADLHKTLLQLQVDSLRQRTASNGANGGLTDDAIDYAATQYRVTGVMPALGRSGQGRAAIVNRAAQQAKDLGQSPAVAIQKQAAYKADADALTKMRSMSSAAEAFETKALQQADIVDSLSQKVNRTQYPIINDGLLAGKARIAGDANTQLLFNALSTFTNEYAKIMEGSTGSSSASSDSARAAAAKLISASLNKGTLSQTLDLMRKEMALTIQGYDATIEHITGRMGGPSTPSIIGPTAPAAPSANPFR